MVIVLHLTFGLESHQVRLTCVSQILSEDNHLVEARSVTREPGMKTLWKEKYGKEILSSDGNNASASLGIFGVLDETWMTRFDRVTKASFFSSC